MNAVVYEKNNASEELRALLARHKVIPVAGAGVSYAAAGLPGWKAVVELGLSYAENRLLITGEQIAQAKEHVNASRLLEAGALLKQFLGAPYGAYTNWLHDLFAFPQVRSDELVTAITNLCAPLICTTNYDYIIEKRSLLYTETRVWSSHEKLSQALTDKVKSVLHFHGVYDDPLSVVLGSDDYQRIKAADPYRFLLNKLWHEYSFLFVGCSRDGVLDEDFETLIRFFRDNFPTSPQIHFLLLNEKEITPGMVSEFMNKYHIQIISYGNDYAALPAFINQLNPNTAEAREVYAALENRMKERLAALITPEGTFSTDPEKVSQAIRSIMPSTEFLTGSKNLSVMNELVQERTKTLQQKKEMFAFHQAIIKEIVSLSDLTERYEFWKKNKQSPEILNAGSWIDIAILAYDALNDFPDDMLTDIRYRMPNAIHTYWFTGYLQFYGQTIKDLKRRKGSMDGFSSAESYFFENLTRIIDSLANVLRLDPAELYPDINIAQTCSEIPQHFIFLQAGGEVSIRHREEGNRILARLPAEENLGFVCADIVQYEGNYLVLAATTNQFMTWNPLTDSIGKIISTATNADFSREMINFSVQDELITFINSYEGIHIFRNINTHQYVKWPIDFVYLARLPHVNDCFFGIKSVISSENGAFVNKIDLDGNISPLLYHEELWQLAKQVPGVSVLLKQAMDEEGVADEKELYTYPFLKHPVLQSGKAGGKDRLYLYFSLEFPSTRVNSLIFLFDYRNNELVLEGHYLKKGKWCIAMEGVNRNNGLDAIAGYMTTDNKNDMVEYYQGSLYNGKLTGHATRGGLNISEPRADIQQVQSLDNDHILIRQRGILFKVNIDTMAHENFLEYKGIINTIKLF